MSHTEKINLAIFEQIYYQMSYYFSKYTGENKRNPNLSKYYFFQGVIKRRSDKKDAPSDSQVFIEIHKDAQVMPQKRSPRRPKDASKTT